MIRNLLLFAGMMVLALVGVELLGNTMEQRAVDKGAESEAYVPPSLDHGQPPRPKAPSEPNSGE